MNVCKATNSDCRVAKTYHGNTYVPGGGTCWLPKNPGHFLVYRDPWNSEWEINNEECQPRKTNG